MSLFRMYWRRTFKRPAVIILWGSMPFIFMTLYTLVFGRSGNIAPAVLLLIDKDKSFASQFLQGSLSQGRLSEFLTVKEVEDLDTARKMFRHDMASAALVMPKGFAADLFMGENIEFKFYSNPREYFRPQILQGITETLVTMGNGFINLFSEPMQSIKGFIEQEKEPSPDDVAEISKMFYTAGKRMSSFSSLGQLEVKVVEQKSKKTLEFNMAAYFFPGLVVFALLALSLSIEARLLADKMSKLNNRIITAPAKPFCLIVNQRLYSTAFLCFMAIICGVIGALAWHIHPRGLVKITAITIGVILFIVGLNSTIFSMAKSQKGGAAISSFIMVFLAMIGGGMFPVNFYPESVKRIANLTPTGLANTGIVESLMGKDTTISLPGFFLYCAAFFLMSIIIGRRRLVMDG